ncbi:SDR family NAD(P)-dependent oxidoreductase [Euzebya sp.]|uniref:SDR family NAD(P)-dependent oxidoreductase n=1 Tax=Euzebya sp. TaxID=1971409 RepID=UPI003511A38C
MVGRLADEVAVVTGAGSGIGRRAAERFAAEGALVVCADLRGADEVAGAINADGGRAVAVATDVTSIAATEGMAAAALDAFGRIDVLFANAGIPGIGSTAGTDPADWDRVISVNLTGVWLSMRAVIPTMVAQGSGSIVATASTAAIKGIRGIAPYAASKAGVIGLCRATAVEVGPSGVRVNAIAPGTTPTPLVTETFASMVGGGGRADDERTARALEREQQRYPMRRFGSLDEVVAVALFLASDESSWVTGATYTVDGGLGAA